MGELETEEQKTRAEVASYLRQLADQLDGDDAVTLELDGDVEEVRALPAIDLSSVGHVSYDEYGGESDEPSALDAGDYPDEPSALDEPSELSLNEGTGGGSVATTAARCSRVAQS